MDLCIKVRSGLVVIMHSMKAVEEKQTMSDIRVKYMYPLSPFQGKTGIIKEGDENSYKYVTVYFDDGIIDEVHKGHLIEIESEDNNMAKLEGYKAVAVIEEGTGYYGTTKYYHYAIFDDGNTYKVGDQVIVSGSNNEVLEIKDIITLDEAKEKERKDITAEVICKVDTSAYDKRVEERKKKDKRKKEADKIKKQMDKMIAEMDQIKCYDMYASGNPELAEKLKVYKELLREK